MGRQTRVAFAFTTEQAPGAIPNGTVVEKVNSAAGDVHPDGSLARVIGSMGSLEGHESPYAYFIEWNDMLGLPVGIGGHRIRPVGGHQ